MLIGALNGLGDERTFHRRDALWQVQKATHKSGPLLDGIDEYDEPSPLERMTREERVIADFNGTGLTVGPHQMAYQERKPSCDWNHYDKRIEEYS